jgi:hypothetical protein
MMNTVVAPALPSLPATLITSYCAMFGLPPVRR